MCTGRAQGEANAQRFRNNNIIFIFIIRIIQFNHLLTRLSALDSSLNAHTTLVDAATEEFIYVYRGTKICNLHIFVRCNFHRIREY